MPASWSVGQKAALMAGASLPSGYAWLRWKYPNLKTDVQFFLRLVKIGKLLENCQKSKLFILDILEEHARARPNHPCILYENERYTYAEVAGNVNRTARWVSGSDPILKKGDVVCVLLHNGPAIVWTWLGLQKKGIIASMINYNLKGSALLHCIKASQPKHIIFGSEFLDAILDIQASLRDLRIGLWMINDARIPGLLPPDDVVTMEISTVSGEQFPTVPITGLGDIGAYIFTSGTTGMPKPAIVTHGRAIGGGAFSSIQVGVSPSDVYYIALPMYHSSALLIAASGCLYTGKPSYLYLIINLLIFILSLKRERAVEGEPNQRDCVSKISSRESNISLAIQSTETVLGGTIAIAKKFSASHFWDDVRRFQVTIFQYIGEVCRYLLAQPKRENDGDYPRRVRAVGNGLRPDIWKEFKTRFNITQIFEFYAATEGNFSFLNIDGHVGSVGRYSWILRRMLDRVEIVDCDYESGKPKRNPDGLCVRLPLGSTGLMLLKITEKAAFVGYRGPEEMTKKKIVRDVKTKGDAYFNTGDLMKIDVDEYVYFIDRLGDTFRWKGENISTQEVSHVLALFPAILEANVYGVHVPGHNGRAGMASIVLHKGATLDFSGLYQHITSSLPDYARPKFLRLLDEMDLTGTFKHKKTELVKRGFAPDGYGEVYIIEPSRKTYVPINHDHIKMLTAGYSKL
ncbi:long-chain fatty acid transport protein 6-like [Strongylocentrotus purpuratus]|uniref:long-chain-fatty-acid--CoA ligase n=1 Tax=Strongylocentrotus purpuratus TaxID=7668 RepID=A0A7M7N7C1_STRPU|nr:long-chain fatty acid transport protein 6-like [Strongylocentrotus purpuratus]